MKNHTLFDFQTNKIVKLVLSDKKVMVETGKTEKTKTTEKIFSDLEEASKYFEKKEWEMLKKGFVMRNQDADRGQPIMHYFVGGGYTGCLSIAAIGEDTAVYQSKDDKTDLIHLIDKNGMVKETIELPTVLPWEIVYHKKNNFLLLDIDHLIYTYSFEKKEFTKITSKYDLPGSFVSVCQSRIAYASHPTVIIKDLESDTILFERNFSSELYSGHSTQFKGAISKNGKLLAICEHSGKLIIVDINSSDELKIVGDFEMIEQIEFVENDTLLVVREKYGTWGVRYFDLTTLKEIEFMNMNSFSHSKEVSSFCFNEDQSKFVIVQRSNAYVFDFLNKKLIHTFKLEHCVKKAKPTFVGEYLGVRTDYGCFSLYAM